MASAFDALDWAVLGAFALLLAGIVWWVARQEETDTEDYFLAGREAGWVVIGASIFASNIGSEHLVGLSSSGFGSGMAYAHYELHSWVLIVLAWVFVPYYLRAQIFTTPEFLDRRYSPATRTFFSFISLVGYVLTKVSVTVYAGGVAIQNIFGIDEMFGVDFFWIAAISLVVLTGIYTVIGGMKAVLWTSALQTPVMLVGSLFLLIIGLRALGGDGGVLEGFRVMQHVNGDRMTLWRPLADPEMPWLAIALGSPIVGLWYWCTDQYIVQRVLSGRDMRQARRGALFGAYLKLLPVFIFMVPGIIAYALWDQHLLTLPLDEHGAPVANTSFPVMVRELLPAGIKGLVLGGAIAALMSSLASLFNSTATLFTVDFYERLVPNRSQHHYVAVGRIATATVVGLGIAWVPIIPLLGSNLYQSLQTVQGYIAPAITAVFFLGIFSGFFTPAAGLWGLVSGFAAGMCRLLLDLVPSLAAGHPLLEHIAQIHWLYFAFGLFVFTIAVMTLLSLVTERKPAAELAGLTYGSITPAQRQEVESSHAPSDLVHTFVILGIIAAVYVYFW